ncbi:hypothetical protein PG653_12065, partial [Riemerella anatipestifer]|nr:hypothetical protein [Riemerella anatipestifer]
MCCFTLQHSVVLGYADVASDKTTHLLPEHSKQKASSSVARGFSKIKTGGDLLSHFRSTIGAGGLNFCV